MKKKLLLGCILILVSFCFPYFQLNPARDPSQAKSSKPSPKAETESKPEPKAAQKPKPAPKPKPEPKPEPPEEELSSIYSSVGLLTYYNQSDPRWADYKYGGKDSIDVYGCGPTVLAMLVSSFTEKTMTPDDMADWARSHHYWVPGSGSKHSLIPKGASAFGLKAESFRSFSADKIKAALKNGHILVALMGPGHFTDNGHFIIIADYWSGNKVTVADPNSLKNTKTPWDINLILKELSKKRTSGGPMWMITPN